MYTFWSLNYIINSLIDVKIALIKESTSDLTMLTNNWPMGKQIAWENYYIPVYIYTNKMKTKRQLRFFFMMTLIFVTTKNDMTKTLHFMLDAHYEKEKPYLKHKGKEGVIK